MRLRTEIIYLTGIMLIVTSILSGFATYKTQESALLKGIDEKLLTTACLAREILPADYHDKITGADSIPEAEYVEIVDRWNRLCEQMDLEYIWSLMLVDGKTVFTSGTSTSNDIRKGDYARFFETHSNPEFYTTAFETMTPRYEIIEDKWGSIRVALLPFKDTRGRPCLFGASMKTAEVDALTRETIWRSIGISVAILAIGVMLSAFWAASLVRPLESLTSLAKGISAGDWGRLAQVTGANEIQSLARSVNVMSQSIQSKINDYINSAETLRESERRYRDYITNTPYGVFIADETGQYLEVNPSACRLTGYNEHELLSMRISDLLFEEDMTVGMHHFQTVVREGKAHGEFPFRPKSGDKRWWSIYAVKLSDSRFLGFCGDITEREQAEERLRMMAEMLDTAPSSITVHDTEGRFLYANRKTFALHGYDAVEFMAINLHDLDVPESEELLEERFRLIMENREASFEVAHYRKDGSRFPLEVFAKTVNWRGDTAILSIATDITERKRDEEALRESEERYRTVVENTRDVVWRLDAHGAFTFVSSAVDMLGYTPAELLGAPMDAILTEESIRGARESLKKRRSGGLGADPVIMELVHRRKDGSQFIGEIRTNPVFGADGQLAEIVGVTRDITERKRAETALAASEASLREAQEIARLGRWELDLITRHLSWSEGIFTLFEVDRDEFAASYEGFFEFVHPDDRITVAQVFEASIRNRRPYEIEHRLLMKDGRIKWVCEIGRTEYDDKGTPIRSIGAVQDITERKQADEERANLMEQLQQAQKMESVGRLAGGVAHDFNNMLGVILGHAELAMEDLDQANPIYEDIKEIYQAATRSADLTRQLLAFARRQTIAPKAINLNDSVAGMLSMLRRLIGERIQLTWRPGAGLGLVKMDPSQVDQILANLCVNARDAINDIGEISIETGNAALGDTYCANHPGYIPGEYVWIAIGDNGRGMDKETLAHIFEPFFTTKGMGGGTGLGLATVYGAVKQNSGFIDVHSEPDHGSTFSIYIPRHVELAELAVKEYDSGAAARGDETILLVEDESAVMRLSAMLLERLGYAVITAGTPTEAIRLAGEYAGRIHLLMTDVVMPEMNGLDLAERLRAIYPDMRLLYMSGYTADLIAQHGVLDEGVHFIQKPFTRAALAPKLREALEEKRKEDTHE